MKTTLRKLAILLCAICVLVATMAFTASANGTNTATADGVTVTLDIPKDSYAQNEELEAIISVENFSGYSLNTVRAEIIVPEGLHLVSGATTKTYSVMTAGSVNENTVKLAADPAPVEEEFPWVVVGGAGVAVLAAAAAVLFFLKGKKVTKAAVLLLVATALAFALLPQPAKAADEQIRVELAETVTVGGEEYTVTAVVTYTVNTYAVAETIDVNYVSREETTREDLEAALVEVAWDYYLKKGYYQYGSMELTTRGDVGVSSPLAKDYGGTWRTNTFSNMEDATADSLILSVCSDYCFNVYDEALEYPVLGNRINAVTIGMFRLAEQCGDGSQVVMRWYDDGVSQTKNSLWTKYGNTSRPDVTAEEAIEFMRNCEETMRPGDIIVARGNGGHQHAMLYVGKGQILHCGGGKFDMDTFVDKTEPDGAVNYATVEGTYITGSDQKGYFKIDGTIADDNTYGAWLIVLRPLNLLTIDDGDEDPGNDKLDVDYVLDVGQLKTELANNENHPTKTSGYGITDATWTRMQYPGMNIDRTVNISLHKTATSGEWLTYRIAITNNSNESYYAAYHTEGRDAFYMGQGYVDLPVSETVPEYTEFIRASHGGEVDENGVIRWTINVPVGETVTLSYTVKVTGQPGDRIVNDGGFVGNIPSNSITTIVGGQKLSSYTQMVMQNFFTAGAAKWNSNDGYKISADPEKDTQFVERIYEELVGVELELPSIEEIVDIFFTQEKYYQPWGLHINHENSLTRYMYTLNDRDEVPEEYQYVWDMLVEGYYGGVWVYSNDYNDEPRITELRYDYLEVGDIIVNIRLKDSFSGGLEYEDREVTAWQLQVYLGNGRFASMNYEGKFRTTSGSIAINPSFGQDLFVCLRPTQEYTNIYEDLPAYEGPAADLTEKDAMNVFVFEASDILLNDEAIARLQKLTAQGVLTEDRKPMNLGYAGLVYATIGLDIYTDGIEEYTYAGVVKACFEDDSNSADPLVDAYEHLYTLAAAPTEGGDALYKMLLYYGGPVYKDSVPLTSLDQLYPGDVLLMGRRTVSAYLAAVYQGDGKFLTVTQMKEEVTSGSQVVNWFDKQITSDEELVNWLAAPINEEVTEFYMYEGYIVLRPSRAYDDINSMVLRDMSTGKLTKEEKEVIANLDLDDWLNAKRPQVLPNFPTWVYKEAHIDLSLYFAEGVTVTKVWTSIFKNDKEYGYYVPMKKGEAGYKAALADMLVDDCYGGKYIAIKDRKILSYSDVQVGDLLCAARKVDGGYVYIVALYQGGSQWMVTETPSSGFGKAYMANSGFIGHDMSAEWIYYFLLRPEQIADGLQQTKSDDDRDIATGELTSAEKNAIANYTTDKKAQLEAFAANAYGNAGVDVTQYVTLNVNNTRKELFTEDGLLIAGDSNFHKMLVPGYYGGAKNAATTIPTNKTFTPEDFQIGDIFCGFMNDKCCDKWQNIIGIYQGNGKFLVSKVSCETHGGLYTDVYGKTTKTGTIWASLEDMNSTYMYYYVLRPQRLAGEHLLNVALSQTEAKLTVGGEITLTYTAIPDTITVEAVTWESSNPSVATVDANGKITAVGAGEAVITLTCDGLTAQCGVKVYARNIKDGVLTAGEQTIIADYTVEKAAMWYKVVNPAYEAAGIYVEAFDTTIGFNDLRKAVLGTTASDYTKMLVAGYTGGSKMTTTSRTFVPADLKVGDIIATATVKCEHGGWQYLTGLYIGDGKFLVSSYANNCTEGCSIVYVDEYGVELTNGRVSFWSDANALKGAYEYYFVLRPQQLASRNITTGVLTADEMATIAGYSAENAGLWYAFVTPAYQAAGIEVDAFNTNIGFNDLRKKVLGTEENDYTKMLMPGYTGGSKMTESKVFTPADLKVGDIIATATAKCAHGSWTYLTGIYVGDGKFLVSKRTCNTEGCASVYTDEYGVALTNGMTSFWSDATALNSAYEYYFVIRPERLAAGAVEGISLNKTEITLEIGNEETLIATPAEGVVWTSSNTAVATVDTTGKVTAVAAGKATITANCDGYTASCEVTVTAPVSGEPREITEGVLTEQEMEAIKNYVPEKASTFSSAIKEAYAAANIDLLPVVGTDSWFTIKGKLFDGAGNVTEGTTAYHKMLMPGYYGGVEGGAARTFAPEDFKIGDVFAGAHNVGCSASGTTTKWVYITGVYIGDGKFMVSESHPAACTDTCSKTYVDTYGNAGSVIWADEDYMKTTYKFYFVFRPERLAADAIQSVSLDKATATVEAGSDVTLAVSKNPATAVDAVTTTWTSSNTSVATVDNTGKVTGIAAGTATITVNCDGYTASCEVTVIAPAGEPREITEGALTEQEMAAFEGFTTTKVTLSSMAGEAYTKANITGIFELLGKLHSGNIRKQVLNDDGTLITTETNYTKMLLPGFYGGSKASTGKTFKPEDLKPGDLFGAVILSDGPVCEHCTRDYDYISAIYLGDETFYVISQYCASCTGYLDKKGEAITTGATKGHSTVSLWTTDVTELEGLYGYYFMLRPERLAADAIQSVSLDKTTAAVEVDGNVTLAVSRNPATAVDAISTTWTSSNTSVATVDDTGKVTGIAAGKAIITVNCDGYTASCEVTVTAPVSGEPRDITEGVLTEEEMNILAAYTAEEAFVWWKFVEPAYTEAGITVTCFGDKTNYNNLRKALINSDGTLVDTASDYKTMFIPGYYGGSKASTGKTFTPADLKVGDIFCTASTKCANGSWRYITALYQGDGKFLVAQSCCTTGDCHMVYTDTYGQALTNGCVSLWSDATTLEGAYEYYFVLRPERLAADAIQTISLDMTELTLAAGLQRTLTVTGAPDGAEITWNSTNGEAVTVDANGKITAVAAGTATITASCGGKTVTCEVLVKGAAREMAESALTKGEMNAISTVNSAAFGALTAYTSGPVINTAYAEAGIDVSSVYAKIGAGDLAKIVKGTKTNDTVKATYVEGTYFGKESGNGTKVFVPADFQVGDVLVANYKCTHSKWPTVTAVYQGEGKFLVARQPGSSGCTCEMEAHFDIYDAGGNHDADGHASIWGEDKDDVNGNVDGGQWLNYLVFRPSLLAD